ncbi:MAG TPA: KTSC domain-containing protein [Tianweitania sediminis]|nr:KTSC domain-containing protein [Tianweitania sediminis]
MPAPLPQRAPRLRGAVPRIRRQPVRSTSIHEVGDDPDTRMLDVKFIGGGLYRYADVPPFLHEALLIAPSPGRFVNERIRGRFGCHRIG